MNYPNLKLELLSRDTNGNDIKTTIGYCNPNASDETLREFGQKLNAFTTNTFMGIRKVETSSLDELAEPFTYMLGNRDLTFESLESAWAKDYIDNEGITGLDTGTTIAVGAANIGDSTTLIFSDGTNSKTKTVDSTRLAISMYAGTGSGSATWLSVTTGDLALILADSDKRAAFVRCLNTKGVAGYNYSWDNNNFAIYNNANGAHRRIKLSIDLSASPNLGKLLYDTYSANTPTGLTVTESGGFYSFAIDSTEE